MSNSPISQALKVKLARTGRWMVACLGMSMLAVSMGHAQLTTTTTSTETTEIRSGLYLFAPGHIPALMVSDASFATTLFSVRIEIRDTAGRVVAAVNGQGGPGRPVRLRPQNLASAGWQEFSAIVRITSLTGAGNAPATVLDDLGPDGFLARNIVCGPGATGGGGQQMCPGWYFAVSPDQPQ